ncbi:MAG: hypothetical protein GX654_10900 [Desulfatiglans sp.]|nr:hypothetical protein [Desulfatiglans sp.]
MARVIRVLCLIMLVSALSFNVINAAGNSDQDNEPKPLEIISITPTGEDVPASRQITFKFNRPVVPVGRMERDSSEIPIEIKPEVKGQWRWIDTSTLALMMDEKNALSPATSYEITVNPGIKAEDGTILKNSMGHTFITERPKVNKTEFKIWDSPGKPAMRIIFNQPVSKDSVEKYLAIRIKGQEGKLTHVNAKSDPEFEKRVMESAAYYKINEYTASHYQLENEEEKPSLENSNEYRVVWLISPEEELTENATIEYMIQPGLESSLGSQKGVENRVIDTLEPFPPFTFLGIECHDKNNKEVFFASDDEKNRCDPARQISLVFSSPVFKKEVIDKVSVEPGLKYTEMDYEEDYLISISSIFKTNYRVFEKYKINLPRRFKPNKKYIIKNDPKNIFDIFGRTLIRPFEIEFFTDSTQFSAPFFRNPKGYTVLEKDADTEMPLITSNLDSIKFTYDLITAQGKSSAMEYEFFPKKGDNTDVLNPLPVRKLLNGRSGRIDIEVTETKPPVDSGLLENYNFKYLSAKVTAFNIHLKKSLNKTIVWVQDIATGDPVQDAKVEIYNVYPDVFISFTGPDGIAVLPGTMEMHPKTPPEKNLYYDIFIRVTKENDIAFITDWPLYQPDSKDYTVWGITDRVVCEPGDIIKYKIYVRGKDINKPVPDTKKGYCIMVRDPNIKIVFKEDVELSEFGTLQGEISIPETGISGLYNIYLCTPFSKRGGFTVELFVADKSSSSFNTKTELDNNMYQAGDNIKVHTTAPYVNVPVNITANLYKSNNPRYLFPSNSPAWDFFFDWPGKRYEFTKKKFYQSDGVLDKDGNLVTNFNINEDVYFGLIEVESRVKNDNGEIISGAATAKYSSRDRFVGLYSANVRTFNNIPFSTEIIVVDLDGNPIPNIPVTVTVERMNMIPSDSKAGVNLSMRSGLREMKIIETHTIQSAKEPLEFSFVPEKAGEYRVTATIKDSKGREHRTGIAVYANKTGLEISSKKNRGNLKIIPDKLNYKIGETARYTVENPYPKTSALVSIERDGIVRHWVQMLDNTSVIQVKIEDDLAPGFYLSVTAMSPRTAPQPADGSEDVGKPDYQSAEVKTFVDGISNNLDIDVKTSKEIYEPGERVRVDLHLKSNDPLSNKPVELATIVLNEKSLQLIQKGRDFLKQFKGLYSGINSGVINSNLFDTFNGWRYPWEFDEIQYLLNENSHGPFGEMNMSGLTGDLSDYEVISVMKNMPGNLSGLKFVIYWNSSIMAESNGNTSFDFEAPGDSSEWRIFVMAVTAGDQMGVGEGRFTVARIKK